MTASEMSASNPANASPVRSGVSALALAVMEARAAVRSAAFRFLCVMALILGLSTGASTSARDTLGVLVSSVAPNGPAERAGIQEGDRIASVNGATWAICIDFYLS